MVVEITNLILQGITIMYQDLTWTSLVELDQNRCIYLKILLIFLCTIITVERIAILVRIIVVRPAVTINKHHHRLVSAIQDQTLTYTELIHKLRLHPCIPIPLCTLPRTLIWMCPRSQFDLLLFQDALILHMATWLKRETMALCLETESQMRKVQWQILNIFIPHTKNQLP